MTLGVVVTYNPPPGFADSVDVLLSQVDELLVIDNGSTEDCREHAFSIPRAKHSNIEFILNERNLGIAAALNQAFARAIERGFDATFVFDDDSLPASGMVDEMLNVYRNYPNRAEIAMVAPNVSVPSAGVKARFLRPKGTFLYERIPCAGLRSLENVSVVISSGALFSLGVYQRLGPFRDDFFIDYVDTEYCLRARQHGYSIVVACQALLIHQLGNQKEAHLGPLTMHPLFHSPLRWYYIGRNRLPMMRMYALRWPHWLLYELMINMYGLVRLVLFEDQKRAKAVAMLLGTWDGLAGRLGPVSEKREAAIMRAGAGA